MGSEIIYSAEGFAEPNVMTMVSLIVGVGIAVLVLIFVGVLGGQVYSQTEPDILAIGGTVTGEVLGTAGADGTLVAQTDWTPVNVGTETVYCAGTPVAAENYTIWSNGTVVVNDINLCANQQVTIDYTYGNVQMASDIKTSIQTGFKALKQTGTYLPIVVVAVVITVVLGLVFSLTAYAGPKSYGQYGGAYLI